MRRSFFIAVSLTGGLLAVPLAFGNIKGGPTLAMAQDAKQRTPVAVPVETTSARAVTARSEIRAVGSLQSDESVNIAPEIAGRISEISFKEGEHVNQSDVMIKLDDALARADVADQEARYELAKSNYERAAKLMETGNITDRARDEAKAAYDSARATLELSRVRLSMHTIQAPFSGVVGLRSVSVGAFVGVGKTIVNLEKIDALKLDFNIPERYLAHVRPGESVQVTVDAFPGRTFVGTIYAIDPMVDVNGRSLKIRARLPNVDGILRPGLFARITVTAPEQQSVLLVPESAIVPRGSGSFIYRIENGKAVEMKVRLGERKAGFVEVLEGIAADAIVVTAGQQRLRHGTPVEVVLSDPRVPG